MYINMISGSIFLLSITLLISEIHSLNNDNNQFTEYNDEKPLFLTPYIESGKIDEAKNLSKVNLKNINIDKIESYSGFITINKTCNSNTFFWFFPARKNYEKNPIMLFLNGGPIITSSFEGGLGISSMSNLFSEVGPFYVDNNQILLPRYYSWTNISSLLFIDNPIGTGFSFTDNDECYAKNINDVSNDLYNFLEQFYKLFSEIKDNGLYAYGKGYAAKFATGLAYKINKKMDNKKIKLNGIIINNGYVDPMNTLGYGKHLYQTSFIDKRQKDMIDNQESIIYKLINEKNWKYAINQYKCLMKFIGTIILNIMSVDIRNPLKVPYDVFYDQYQGFLTKKETRYAIHVGDLRFNSFNPTTDKYLMHEFLISVKPWIEEIIESKHNVLFLNGQSDLLINNVQIENVIENLNISFAYEYYLSYDTFYLLGETFETAKIFSCTKVANNLWRITIYVGGQVMPGDNSDLSRSYYNNMKRFLSGDSYNQNDNYLSKTRMSIFTLKPKY